MQSWIYFIISAPFVLFINVRKYLMKIGFSFSNKSFLKNENPIFKYEEIELCACPSNYAIKITSNEISEYNSYVEAKDFACVRKEEVGGHGEIIERICNTVGETTHDEERNTKEGGENVSLTSKGDCRGHDESTTYSKKTSAKWTNSKSPFKNGLCCFL